MSAIRSTLSLFRAATAASTRTFSSTAAPATAGATQASPSASQQPPPGMNERGLGTVRDVLKTKGEKFYHTSGDAFVIDAVKQMVKHNIGSLIIVEGVQKRPIGIVTETDYLNKVIVLGRSSSSTLVKDIMSTKKFTFVSPSATLHDCMHLMTERRIRHIPVVDDGSHKVLGMVSIGDIVSELVAAHKRNAEHLQSFISGSYWFLRGRK